MPTNTAVVAFTFLSRRLMLLLSLPLGCREQELAITSLVGLSAPPRAHVKGLQPHKSLLKRHLLHVIELLDPRNDRVELIRDGVEELLDHGQVIECRAE